MAAALGLGLAACNTTGNDLSSLAAPDGVGTDAFASASSNEVRSDVPPPLGVPSSAEPDLLGGDPTDDLSVGKKYFRAGNYGMAERYLRRAVELHARDAGAWLALGATYDRLRRFDFADRAYARAIDIAGPTVEIMNNQGYSYMLRGDARRARATLVAAQRKDPGNRFVMNNLRLLDESARQSSAVQ